MAKAKDNRKKPTFSQKWDRFHKYKGQVHEFTPVNDMLEQYRPFKGKGGQHGPVKVIYSRDVSPVVDPPTKLGFRAGELRRKAPPCEFILRDALKVFGPHGIEFQHSVAMFGFIADFYCPTRALVIELDGPQHANHKQYDRRRDRVFWNGGVRVIRFPSSYVYTQMDQILTRIANELRIYAWR